MTVFSSCSFEFSRIWRLRPLPFSSMRQSAHSTMQVSSFSKAFFSTTQCVMRPSVPPSVGEPRPTMPCSNLVSACFSSLLILRLIFLGSGFLFVSFVTQEIVYSCATSSRSFPLTHTDARCVRRSSAALLSWQAPGLNLPRISPCLCLL